MSVLTSGDLTKDAQLVSPPSDSVSDLAFSSQSDHLAVAAWDSKVRIYEVAQTGNSDGKALYDHGGPVFSVHWAKDGEKIISSGADCAARVFDVKSQNATQVAIHDAPIRCVRFVQIPNSWQEIIVTGSWDKTLKYWDMRQDRPIAAIQMQERVYCLDSRENTLVVGTAERYINVINLSNPGTIARTSQSLLKFQTRAIACFPDGKGFAVGGIEGRCAVENLEEKPGLRNFTFKCHRETQGEISKCYAINAISFHPEYQTFSTAGSDGNMHFWDKDTRSSLKTFRRTFLDAISSISASGFNRNGSIFAYAISYDWSQGIQGNSLNYPIQIMLHPVEKEATPRSLK